MSSYRIGIIGGSGLYQIEGLKRPQWVKVKTPFGPPSDAFLTGQLAGREVLFLPRHKRGHCLLPSELNHRANVWAMKELGVAWIVSVSAVGALQARYRPCDIVLPSQFLDRTKQSAAHTFFGEGIVAHVALADPICEELRRWLLQSCRAVGARVHEGGTYVNMEGPAFSTRAESLLNHRQGLDVIGMTNLGEAKCAREAEIAYATMAMVTDYDCWKTDEAHVTVETIIANLNRNAAQAKQIIADVVPRIPAEPGCTCHRALEHAILTDRKLWPAKTRAKLRPLLARFLGLAAAFLLSSTCWSVERGEGNWPQFRGPQARGVAEGFSAPSTWNLTNGQNILWQTPIPGLGHSSPIIWGDRIWVATAVQPGAAELKVGLYGDVRPVEEQGPQQWRLLSLNKATGRVVWDVLAHEGVPRSKRHPKSTHCNSTPATDGQHVVALFGSEGLFCFDITGKQLWHKDLGPLMAAFYILPSAQWGFASSPVIHDDKVLVQCDVLTNSFIAAFSLADGHELWRTPRDDVPTWSTPSVTRVGDRQEILVNGWRHLGGYDLLTGQEIWRLNGGGDIPVPTPIIGDGLAFFTSAHGRYRPVRAIRLTAAGNITPTDIAQTNAAIAWSDPRRGNYMQTPIIVGEWLYACFDTGLLTCFEARTGAVRYQEQLGAKGQGFSASPVSADHKLYFTSELGDVFVVPASGTFSVLATNSLHETCMATPAVSEGSLFFRTRSKLVAIGQRPSLP